MDEDIASPGRDSGLDDSRHKRKDKGKARGTWQEDEQDDVEEHAEERADQWNEEELREARMLSLAHAVGERSHTRRGGYTDEYTQGRDVATANVTSGDPFARQMNRSDAGTSGRRERSTAPRVAYEFETQEWDVPVGHSTHGRPRGRRNDSQWPGYSRERSEFRPLPNTRAADYITQSHAHEHGLPQRSPMSHVAGLSRPVSPQGHGGPARGAEQRWRSRGEPEAEASFFSEHRHSMQRSRRDDWTPPRNASPSADAGRYAGEGEDVLAEEDGEIFPTILDDQATQDDEPMARPEGGVPRVHHDDPETAIRGMSTEWVREVWGDPPNSDLLVDIYNYRYSEDESLNRRISETLRTYIARITGEHDFDVVPPEAETDSRLATRDLPTSWAIRGLTPEGVARATERHLWSFRQLSFFTAPRATRMPSWIGTLGGFLDGNVAKIRAAITRVLREPDMMTWIANLVMANPEFRGRPVGEAIEAVIRSLRIEVLQMGNGNYLANFYLRSPTRIIREWRRWAAELRGRRYRTFAIGTGRMRNISQCPGCRSVAHPSHLCPYPRGFPDGTGLSKAKAFSVNGEGTRAGPVRRGATTEAVKATRGEAHRATTRTIARQPITTPRATKGMATATADRTATTMATATETADVTTTVTATAETETTATEETKARVGPARRTRARGGGDSSLPPVRGR